MTAPDARDVVLGVDGGGTKTVAVVCDLSGTVLGFGRAGSCDAYSNPSAAEEVERAVRTACAGAQVDPAAVAVAVYGLCGADWPENFAHWRAILAERRLGADVRVVNDAIGVLEADLPEGNAVAVVCGTGAGTAARNRAGETWHSSWWQLTQGGIELTKRACQAVYRAELGIEPPTSLSGPACAHYGARDAEDLLHMFTTRDAPRPTDRAGLVPVLFAEAERGDAAARRILATHGADLADYAAAAARKVGILDEGFALLLTGGVFRNRSQVLRASLLERLRERAPRFHAVEGGSEPVKGAVLAALRARAGRVPQQAIDRLRETFPPSELFHTGDPVTLDAAGA